MALLGNMVLAMVVDILEALTKLILILHLKLMDINSVKVKTVLVLLIQMELPEAEAAGTEVMLTIKQVNLLVRHHAPRGFVERQRYCRYALA